MGSVAGAVLLSLWAGLARGASSSAAYVVRVTLCACLAAGCLSSGAVEAATTDGQTSVENSTDKRLWTVGIRWENDTIANHDRFYTNGSAVWLAHTGESWADPIMNWLPWGQGRHTVTYSLSQAMFTPEDTARAVPDPTDRPYAGVLTFGLGLHVDRDNRYNGLKLILGVVGPWALGGETQREFHRLVGSNIPRGWDYQLHNEPIINLAYEHRRKYRVLGRADGWAVEAIPVVGLMAGNLLIQGNVAGHVRLGYKIPDDFGTTLLRGMSELPPPRWNPAGASTSMLSTLGFYVFGGVAGNFVLRDLTLDGNTFKDSPSVDKEWFVPTARFGVGVGNRRFLATFTYVYAGKTFKGHPSTAEYGALTFSYFF